MQIRENEIKSIVITKENEVVAVISDKEIIEKDKYKVIMEPAK
ncbi:hypothetical protein [Clostridium botulinum]|nr:hypothetical protein [Clostridium botulinum]